MNYMGAVSGILSSVGGATQKNAQALAGGSQTPQQSPTSAFVQAARQASLERQQAQAAQVQTAPTAVAATQGGAMAPMGGGSALQVQGAPPATQSLSVPPGGMITQGQPDPELLAAMYRNF